MEHVLDGYVCVALVIYSLLCYSIHVMSSAAARKSDNKQTPPKSTVILLLATAADTTWRMFVPALGGALIGLWLDAQWHTEPWASIVGLAIGIAATVVLVRNQYKRVENDK